MTLSAGRRIASPSGRSLSVRPILSSARRPASGEGIASTAARSSAVIGRTVCSNPAIVIVPSSARIDASSRASAAAGFGAQLP